jgi:hypothetical protein
MANLTITLDDAILRRARKRAIDGRTSVNAVVAAFLERYAGESQAGDAMTAFFDLADTAGAGSGPHGRDWTRDDLYERGSSR